MKKGLALSLVLHSAIFAALLLQIPSDDSPKLPVNTLNVSTDAPPPRASGDRARGKVPRQGPKINFGFSGKAPNAQAGNGKARPHSEGSSGTGDAYEIARNMGAAEESGLHPFFSEIWRKIDAATGYPDVFIRQRLAGSATVQVMVHQDGTFTGRVLSVESESPLLKTYALAVLIHSLSTPLPKNRWAPDKDLPIAVRFDFQLLGPGEHGHASDPAHFKNVLAITRRAYVEPLLNEKFHELVTRYIPPIIVLPGVVFVDVIRLYQYIENWGKADSKAKEDVELEQLKRKWQETIRPKSGSDED